MVRRMQPYFDLPTAFARDVLGADNDPFQEDALDSFCFNQRTAVAGAKGIGKGYLASQGIWWFMSTRPKSKVGIISASATNTQANLWQELATFYGESPYLQSMFEMGDRTIRSRKTPKEHFAFARQGSARYSKRGAANEKQAEGLSGMYAEYVAWIADEATAIDDVVLSTIDTSVNRAGHRFLMLANPIRTSGFFHDVFMVPRRSIGWVGMNVPYTASRMAHTPEGIRERERWIRNWGEDSGIVQAFVFGQFPKGDSGDTVYPPGEVMEAFARHRTPDPEAFIDIGIDPARYGSDECCFCVQQDNVGLEMVTQGKIDQVDIVGKAITLARYWHKVPKEEEMSKEQKRRTRFRIDVGLGVGPIDTLRKMGFLVAGVDNGRKPSKKLKMRYDNLGTELWCETRDTALRHPEKPVAMGDMIVNGRKMTPDGEPILVHQLTSRPYTYPVSAGGRMRMLSKEELHRTMDGSPDRADAWILAFGDVGKMGLVDPMKTIYLG